MKCAKLGWTESTDNCPDNKPTQTMHIKYSNKKKKR